MSETVSIPRLSVLWKNMPAGRRAQAAEAFWRDANAAAEQAEAISTIAQRLKFRTKSLVVMPIARKTQYLLGLPNVSDVLAGRLLVAYHIEHQRPMMVTFLDALGVAHDNGMISDDTKIPQDSDKIRGAAKVIVEKFPADDVALYLSTLSWQDTETWAVLAELPEARTLNPPASM